MEAQFFNCYLSPLLENVLILWKRVGAREYGVPYSRHLQVYYVTIEAGREIIFNLSSEHLNERRENSL